MELWPALQALAGGELTADQRRWLIDTLGIEEGPRRHGPAKEISIAHRTFTDRDDTPLVLDLGLLDEDGWVMTLFFRTGGRQPSTTVVEEHRRLFRYVIESLGLELDKIEPAATADEVFTSNIPSESEFGVHWNQHIDNLEDTWFHLGLKKDAPREVKEANLRWLIRQQVWAHVPDNLRQEAEEFLQGE